MNINKLFITALALGTGLSLAGCGTGKPDSTSAKNASIRASYGSSVLDVSEVFTERDLKQAADTADSTAITLSDGEDISITGEGMYLISGSASDATITVNAEDTAKVQLVLDGIAITNESAPAIYAVSADKCFITLTDKESSLTVTGAFAADGETKTDGVIFSKDDVVMNGTGTLNISAANGNGIVSKDDLKVTGGTYNITVSGNGLEANDRIAISDGTFNINAGKDAIHCKNSDDATLGWVYVSGGIFDLNAASDGIEGASVVEIDGGTFTISGQEGIEATYVQINGGNITITASDDGINASNKSSAYESVVEFNGGYTKVTVGQGDTDAVDSNGAIIINAGTIDVTSTMSSFDYNTSAEFNGGTVIINGTEVSELPQAMGGPGGGRGGMRKEPPADGEMPKGVPPEGGGHRGGMRKEPPADGEMSQGVPPEGGGHRGGMRKEPPADGEMPKGAPPEGGGRSRMRGERPHDGEMPKGGGRGGMQGETPQNN